MQNPVAARRTELARAFATRACELPRLEHTRLRFSLGTSISELKVPFHVSADASRIFAAAARQLAFLLLSRHRDQVTEDDFDPFLVSPEFGAIPPAQRLLGTGAGGPDVRATAELGFRLHPALTGGVMAAWLGSGGGGRSLVALVIEVLRKAFAEMQGSRGREETPTVAALMLSSQLAVAEAALREAHLPKAVDRHLRGAAGVGVFLALRLGAERALREANASPELAMRVEAPLSATALLGGRAALAGSGANLFGADLTGGLAAVDEAVARFAAGGDPRAWEQAVLQRVASDEGTARFAERDAATAFLRDRLAQLAMFGEQRLAPVGPAQWAIELVTHVGALTSFLSNEKARKDAAKDFTQAAEGQPDATRAALRELGAALKGFKDKDPAAAAGLSRAEAHSAYAAACLAAGAELWLERALLPAKRALEPRTGAESEGGLETEYSQGRLYLVSAGPNPLLKAAGTSAVAHLFVDVKDFTRRTNLLGQAAIAEFLRREFYLPILTSAKHHYGGMSHLADKGGVSVNNLLGDALSASGGIEALVALALDIRRHLAVYERQLAAAVSTDQVTQALRDIENAYAQKLAAAPPEQGPALENEREAAFSRARGEGLEAGVFISFGPAPMVVTLDDELFGRLRVAIADRINESARGTARSSGARARADATLEAERRRRQNRRLAHPWSVFVGAPFSIAIPPAEEDAARAAVQANDLPAAMRAVADPVKRAVEASGRAADRPGDIYNAGAAVSEEALLAYQEATGGRRVFKQVQLSPDQLHPDLRDRYCFGPDPLYLLASFKPDGALAELFRYAGKVVFKGLERGGGIGVWELIGEGPLLSLFALHHAAPWFRQ